MTLSQSPQVSSTFGNSLDLMRNSAWNYAKPMGHRTCLKLGELLQSPFGPVFNRFNYLAATFGICHDL